MSDRETFGTPQEKIFIEGMVTLKRKKQWVKRYAIVNNNLFSYKKSKKDNTEKRVIDLT